MFKKTPPRPPIITITGVPKIGKSSFAAHATKPVFLQTEDVGDGIDADKSELLHSFQDVMDALRWLAEEDHDYRTVVVDSIDWLEPLIWAQACAEHGWSDIEEPGWGKGYAVATYQLRNFIDAIKWLRDNKDMTVILVAHTEVKKYDDPEHEAYDRYQIKMQKKSADIIMEASDIILFANYRKTVTQKGKDKNAKVKAVGSGERVLFTEERPAFKAGNRFDLPSQIPFDRDGNYWKVIVDHVPFYNQTKTQKKEAANG